MSPTNSPLPPTCSTSFSFLSFSLFSLPIIDRERILLPLHPSPLQFSFFSTVNLNIYSKSQLSTTVSLAATSSSFILSSLLYSAILLPLSNSACPWLLITGASAFSCSWSFSPFIRSISLLFPFSFCFHLLLSRAAAAAFSRLQNALFLDFQSFLPFSLSHSLTL